MSGKRRRKKKSIFKSRFYQVYFILVALALVAIIVGTIWLNGLLKDYEDAQPVYVAKEVAKLFENADYETIYNVDTAAKSLSGDEKALYIETLSEMTRGADVKWAETFSMNSGERKYRVTLNGERFATFTLVPSGQVDARGNRLWTLGSVTTNVTLLEPTPEPTPEPTQEPVRYACRVTVPEGYSVRVDGTALTADSAQITRKQLFEDGFLPKGVNNPTLVDYAFEWDSENPGITVVDANGTESAAQPSADGEHTWTYPLPEDEAIRAKFSDTAISLGTKVAKYISQDGKKKSIERVCAPGSPAKEIFENLHNRYTTPHTGVDVQNAEASQFYRLADNCFTCHVSFDYILHTEEGDKVYPTAYTFCVVNNNGKYRLYNMLSF